MAATTTDRNTQKRIPGYLEIPVAATTKIPAGVLVCQNTTGYAVNGSDAASLVFAGVSVAAADNTTGAAGALTVRVEEGVFGPFATAAALTAADIGKPCHISDNQTVAVAGTSHAVVCGHIWEVTAAGAWIDTRGAVRGAAASS